VRVQLVRVREPLAAFADSGELPVTLLLDRSTAAFEGEELVVPDRDQPLPGPSAGADLHALVEADVVDHIDAGERKVGVGCVTVAPIARCADPHPIGVDALNTPAEGAGAREGAFRHECRLRAASDTVLPSPDPLARLVSKAGRRERR
jgi:hypothetical protein